MPQKYEASARLDAHRALPRRWQRQLFRDTQGNVFSVGLAMAFAQDGHGEFCPEFDIDRLPTHHFPHLNLVRALICDTHAPILVLVQGSGRVSLADGKHRAWRARYLQRKSWLPAYVLPWTYAAKLAARIEFEQEHTL